MAARLTFRTLRRSMQPRWLTDGEGGLVAYALDMIRDAFVNRLVQGYRAGFPQSGPERTPAPTDALNRIGQDRRVIRGINESDADYAARLVNWLVDRRTAGNPYTLMRQLAAYTGAATGCSFRTYDVRGNCYSRAADGTQTANLNTGLWNWDGDTARWSRFWVIIYPGTLWTTGPGSWGSSSTAAWNGAAGLGWGSTAAAEHVRSLQAIVADWKPAGTRCQNIVLAFDLASFNPATPEPDGLWRNWSKVVAGVRVPARLSTARYLDGI